jgi:dTDP-4-amino-4,6-dideoxygalactose transaminase
MGGMGGVQHTASVFNLKVIEDSCEAMFVTQDGKSVGAMSDIACFSFYTAHLLVAGVGGIATTNSPRYAGRMRSLVNHGLSLDNLNPDANFAPRPMLNRKFIFSSQGHSYRITEFEAALALAPLEDYQSMLSARRANAAALTQMLEPYQDELSLPHTLTGNTHSWMFYTLVTRREDKRELCAYLNAHGIETRDLPSLLYQPCYGWDANSYPVSKHLATHAFYTGVHPGLVVDDMQYIADVIGNYYERGKR